MTVAGRVTDTGPVSAQMSEVLVDIVGPGGKFGELLLPETKLSPQGTDVVVDEQVIKITDMEAFRAFVRAATCDEEVTLTLANGKAKMKAMMLSATVDYTKTVTIKGMGGPKITLIKTELDGEDGFINYMSCENPSPIEMDQGVVMYALKNDAGEKFGEQAGELFVKRGVTEFIMKGKIVKGVGASETAKFIGIGAEKDTWVRETTKFVNSSIDLTPQLQQLATA